MRVRARVNQADVNELQVGQVVRVGLDAYPALFFDGRVTQISPLGVTSVLSAKVRTFVVLIDVNGAHPNLMPDLPHRSTSRLPARLARSWSHAMPFGTTVTAPSFVSNAAPASKIGRSPLAPSTRTKPC